jgi:hypothetical protein
VVGPHRRPLHGADKGEAYGRRNAVPGEMLVRVTPTHVVAQKATAVDAEVRKVCERGTGVG